MISSSDERAYLDYDEIQAEGGGAMEFIIWSTKLSGSYSYRPKRSHGQEVCIYGSSAAVLFSWETTTHY